MLVSRRRPTRAPGAGLGSGQAGRQGRSIIMQGRRCELRGWDGHGHRARWRQPAWQCPRLPQHSPSPPLCPAPYVEPEMPSSWKSDWHAAMTMVGPSRSQAQAQAHSAGGRGAHACIASAGPAGWCAIAGPVCRMTA
jgi:hypothetical protein